MSLIKAIIQLNYTEFTTAPPAALLGALEWPQLAWVQKLSGPLLFNKFYKSNTNTSIEMPGCVVKCRALRLKWQAAILVSYLALFRSHICKFSRRPTAMHTNTDTQHALWDTVAVPAKHIPLSILSLCARVSVWLRHCFSVFGGDQWQTHYVKLLCVTIRKWSDERAASRVTGS